MINFPVFKDFKLYSINNNFKARTFNTLPVAPKLAPLQCDTVSFQGSKRINGQKPKAEIYARNASKGDITLDGDFNVVKRKSKKLEPSDRPNSIVAQAVYDESEFAYNRFKSDISNIFGLPVLEVDSLTFGDEFRRAVQDSENKNSPILAITARRKSPKSIAEKMGSKKIKSKKAALNEITDLAGIRILVSRSDKTSGDYIMDKLTEAVKKDWIKISEVEVYKNSELSSRKYDYFNRSKLDKLSEVSRKKGIKNFTANIKDTESGYTAIHMLVDLPGGIKGELQVMGPDVMRLKELEDLSYKTLTGKNISKKYAGLEKMFKALESQDRQYAEFMDYTRQAYAHERKREPHSIFETPEFLRLPQDTTLPQCYDFNNILKIKQQADFSKIPQE